MINLNDFELLTKFMMDIDGLKLVERRSFVIGMSRRENSAEHSWHIAMAAWVLAKHCRKEVSIERILQLALVHDLCELDEGDTFIYAVEAEEKFAREKVCIDRLMDQYGDLLDDIEGLWLEYERLETLESKLLRIADRFLPFMHNIAAEGQGWREHGITRSQVVGVHEFIGDDFPELYAWISAHIEKAVELGWLVDE